MGGQISIYGTGAPTYKKEALVRSRAGSSRSFASFCGHLEKNLVHPLGLSGLSIILTIRLRRLTLVARTSSQTGRLQIVGRSGTSLP